MSTLSVEALRAVAAEFGARSETLWARLFSQEGEPSWNELSEDAMEIGGAVWNNIAGILWSHREQASVPIAQAVTTLRDATAQQRRVAVAVIAD